MHPCENYCGGGVVTYPHLLWAVDQKCNVFSIIICVLLHLQAYEIATQMILLFYALV